MTCHAALSLRGKKKDHRLYSGVWTLDKLALQLYDRPPTLLKRVNYRYCYVNKYVYTLIEKYTRGVSAVESILTLDRLRQSVAVKELEQARGQPIIMRKTASVPNFSQVVKCVILYHPHKTIPFRYAIHNSSSYYKFFSYVCIVTLPIILLLSSHQAGIYS